MAGLRVVRAGFTPLKSTRHLPYETVELDAHGPVGDRAFCLVDTAVGRVLRTVSHTALLALVARWDGTRLSVTVPGADPVTAVPTPTGETVTADYWGRPVALDLLDGPHSALFSDHLGYPVRLAASPRGAVVYADPITLVGTASLRFLAERAGHPALVEEAARFRPTLVVETDEPFEEERWHGHDVAVGSARLRIGTPVPRCAVIDHHPVTGRRDVHLLAALLRSRPAELPDAGPDPGFGVFAHVTQAGLVSPEF